VIRERHFAVYLFPGVFMPEETYRELVKPTFEQALASAPDDEEGYFRKDMWYAVKIHTTVEERFTSDEGEVKWVEKERRKVSSWILGEKVHHEDPQLQDEKFIILRSNIRNNSENGFGVLCRTGNWQIDSDYDYVVSNADLEQYKVSPSS
jgi:hypothetical protein